MSLQQFLGGARTGPGRWMTQRGVGGGPGRGWRFPQWTRTSILWLPRFLQMGTLLPALADSTTVTATSPFWKRVENLGGGAGQAGGVG